MSTTLRADIEAKHLFEVVGETLWVVATSEAEARKRLGNSDYPDFEKLGTLRELPDSEHFAMRFDAVPDDLKADCNHKLDDEYGECIEDCGEDYHVVSGTAGFWANSRDIEPVFGDLE